MILKHARRVAILVIGATVIAFGAVMLVVPGPGLLTIALGLAVLATEFVWARRWLKHLKDTSKDVANAFLGTANDKAS